MIMKNLLDSVLGPELEDSPDLTDEQVAHALKLTPEGVSKYIEATECPQCQITGAAIRYAIKRRRPHLYLLVTQTCAWNHSWCVLFEADWIDENG